MGGLVSSTTELPNPKGKAHRIPETEPAVDPEKRALSTVWAAELQGSGKWSTGQEEVGHRGVYPPSPGKAVSGAVLVGSGCSSRMPQTGGLPSRPFYFCSCRLDAQEHLVSGVSPLMVHKPQSSLRSVVEGVSRGLFIRALVPFPRAPPP